MINNKFKLPLTQETYEKLKLAIENAQIKQSELPPRLKSEFSRMLGKEAGEKWDKMKESKYE